MPTAATEGSEAIRPAFGLTDGLALGAAPTFALMAGITALNAPPMALCSTAPGGLPIDGMSAMYLLMSLFHLSPWLKRARLRASR
ncbi:hypothetical protein NVS89_19525 [Ancylobacter sp. MQZ15Z-1]|uniref:Uncharacterized protein n=1 Tax=Ancylobacter mangrovi TaxID=2972472 RepID=A0A9X2PLJ5_9HYPH|nr:hypothetical protein [Ancylobacter mangrovi]MCS0497282.1 hypothetical protein [Ancylobacter mangrovi]